MSESKLDLKLIDSMFKASLKETWPEIEFFGIKMGDIPMFEVAKKKVFPPEFYISIPFDLKEYLVNETVNHEVIVKKLIDRLSKNMLETLATFKCWVSLRDWHITQTETNSPLLWNTMSISGISCATSPNMEYATSINRIETKSLKEKK